MKRVAIILAACCMLASCSDSSRARPRFHGESQEAYEARMKRIRECEKIEEEGRIVKTYQVQVFIMDKKVDSFIMEDSLEIVKIRCGNASGVLTPDGTFIGYAPSFQRYGHKNRQKCESPCPVSIIATPMQEGGFHE